MKATTFATRHASDEPDLAELRDLLANARTNPDGKRKVASLGHKLSAYLKNVPGSPPYWWDQKQNVAAILRTRLFEDDELPFAFCSASMAECFWVEIFAVLRQAGGCLLRPPPAPECSAP